MSYNIYFLDGTCTGIKTRCLVNTFCSNYVFPDTVSSKTMPKPADSSMTFSPGAKNGIAETLQVSPDYIDIQDDPLPTVLPVRVSPTPIGNVCNRPMNDVQSFSLPV